ncbi:hypothetical protein HYZ64_02930 [Candidatus Berkelbacteria bacterium]|nr:hypothetical protein [Candidatus Berkelbacteria bacterium]
MKELQMAEAAILRAKQLLARAGYQEQVTTPPRIGITGGQIIEGTFDGEAMIDGGGQRYQVPANYASKSKMVEGDALKLTILPDGSQIFKQIGPVSRRHERGTIIKSGGGYRVMVDDRAYQVLLASITFHKVKPGDGVAVLLPEGRTANFATIESSLVPA